MLKLGMLQLFVKQAEEQKCYRRVQALLKRRPGLTPMVGPADRAYDTRHFWAVTPDGKVVDPSRRNYGRYSEGRPARWLVR